MQIVYLERRTYPKKEIAEILGINPQSGHFKRDVTRKMQNLGFKEGDDFVYKRGDVTVLYVPQTYEEKITYLVRLLGVDIQVDPKAFTTFLYRLALDGYNDCNKMPWAERESWLRDNCDIQVSERTLRSWTNKLMDLGIITKDNNDYEWWSSSKFDGETIREPVQPEEMDKVREYWKDFWKIKAEADKLYPDDKQEAQKYLSRSMWGKYGCCYYKCKSFMFCAWENNPIMREIRDLILEHEGL